MSIIIPPFVGSPTAAPASGGVLAYDETWLREPRLLVPGMQPLGSVQLNKDNQVAKKLSFLFVGNANNNLVGKGKTLVFDTGASKIITANGRAVSGISTSTYAIKCPNINFSGTGAFTFLVYAAPPAVAEIECAVSLCSGVADQQSYILFNTDAAYSASAGTVSFGAYTGALTAFSSKIDGKPHTFAHQRIAIGSGNTNCWVDGQIIGTTNDSADLFTEEMELFISGINGYTGWTRSTPYFLAAFAPIALTNAEISAWSRDPFSLVIPA